MVMVPLGHTQCRRQLTSRRLRRTLPPAKVTLLSDRELGTLALRQRDPRLRALTDNEDVGDTETTMTTGGQSESKSTNRVAKVRSSASLA
jgi:hypothetical protein